ncbi:Gfo/Idh/MocA family oxidoreductase [Cellulophaga baltica]|uniref:Gfo/Idh/MocA family protein n=1 Tax=Cellulophaga TaxID=104264 RepID=UPI001C06D480|nr:MULTISPECIES: Gfo/Idh/MocA family oxidoreductase [Cellulophaga]MBU2996110.1 Gfo/Idh/MocA family oxidoreductase [Cellulophaga baltica]MDO6767505.1 Gfo/Idh/MocA family oxidoreductase [Cellulophaga sp. 1_MG-2023]
MKQNIRWGVIGLGNIAHKFVKDLQLVEGANLTAVASRSIEKAKEFASIYNAKKAYGGYQELYESEEVDVIYIATPHSFHANIAIEAMKNGKHILCEKPLGVNSIEVHKMIATAQKHKVFLMEALWTRFNPSIVKIKELIAQNVIGDIKYIHADFAFQALDRSEDGRLLNPNLAGGSLLDIGIYPIFLSYLLLGKPNEIQAFSKMYKTGIEVQTSMIFDFESAQATLYSGLNSKSDMKATISGTKGSIFIQPRWHETQGFSVEIDSELMEYDLSTTGMGFYYEILEVQNCISRNKIESELWSHQNSKDLIGLIDSVRAKTGVVFPFEN